MKKADDAVYKQLHECCLYRELLQSEEETLIDTAQAVSVPAASEPSLPAANNLSQTAVVTGVVLEEDRKGAFRPLYGASIVWLGTEKGTTTDSNGVFFIPPTVTTRRLVISYAGYEADTITITDNLQIRTILAKGKALNEVRVVANRASTYINALDPFRKAIITQKELLKAACCNLSESFETNPSVDVSFNDAVTGSKQIQLLGLSGNYTQLTVENLPGLRGLATPLGLNSVPGTWVESIQLIKGTGSVVNGYESIAGQINVELKKPQSSEQLYANFYTNDNGKTDLNLNLSKKLSDKWSTALLLHDAFAVKKMDVNRDSFRDFPTGNLFSGINRWSFDNGKGVMVHLEGNSLRIKRPGVSSILIPKPINCLPGNMVSRWILNVKKPLLK